MRITAIRSMHGLLLVTCRDCHVMCVPLWHPSSVCWTPVTLLSAGLHGFGRRRFGACKSFDLVHLNKCKAAPVHALKACRRSRGTAPSVLKPGIVLSVSGQLHASAVLYRIIQNWGLGRHHSRAGRFGERENLFSQPRTGSRNCPSPWSCNKCKNLSFLFSVWFFTLMPRRLQCKRVKCHVTISLSSDMLV
jgi:hypothetical protein